MAGASEKVLGRLVQANAGEQPSYGVDEWCRQAEQLLSKIFQTPLRAFFVSTGTVANSLALSALVAPWGGILCQSDAHLLADESSAPEFFTGGARLMPLPAVQGKLHPSAIATAMVEGHPPHYVKPEVLSITQVNERGLVYRPEELATLCASARQHGLKVHMDGARFANAVAALGCAPADLSWRAGVDVLCLGASKNGALLAEAILFFDPELARSFEFRVKRAGQMAAKSRIFGAQFTAWLEDDHWLELARHANAVAAYLNTSLQDLPTVRLAWPVQANEVFAILPATLAAKLRSHGAIFYDWSAQSLPPGMALADDEVYARFVTSFASSLTEVDALLAAVNH